MFWCRYRFQFKNIKVWYRSFSFLKDTLNITNHCKVIIYCGLYRILNMNIHNKIYIVIMQKSTVYSTVKIPNNFFGTYTITVVITVGTISIFVTIISFGNIEFHCLSGAVGSLR